MSQRTARSKKGMVVMMEMNWILSPLLQVLVVQENMQDRYS
jgi:ACR3 family arsenite efflux pump ArsB